jgi:hypothetical protein
MTFSVMGLTGRPTTVIVAVSEGSLGSSAAVPGVWSTKACKVSAPVVVSMTDGGKVVYSAK